MALPRCLCLILILWMAGSRPSAAIGPGASFSDPWWGSKDANVIRNAARKFDSAGNFPAAEAQYQRGYDLAARRHDEVAALRFLSSMAGSRFAQFRYRAALDAYLEARRRAAAIGDLADVGGIDANLSSLYLQVWDLDSALRAAEQARAAVAAVAASGAWPKFEGSLLLQLGRLHEALGDGQAERFYADGIEAARARGDVRLEAQGWGYVGECRMARGELAGAERALDEAFRLSTLFDRGGLPTTWVFLGALKLAQGDYSAAAVFTDRAIAASERLGTAFPLYLLEHQRGEIRMARGDKAGALKDFASAVDLASRWRLEVPPSISSLTATNVELEKRVFDSFIEASAGDALRTGNRREAVEAFEAVELNRAASLRESLSFADVWRKKLPPKYWEVQGRFRAEQARMLRAGERKSAVSEQLSLRLTEMEAETGPFFTNHLEKFHTQNSLIHFQDGVGESEMLLTFHLGTRESYLWAVTRRSMRLHRLGPGERLKSEIEQFREAVRRGDVGAETLGARLYRDLFGGLSAEERSKRTWLLSVEGALFDLPFPALVTGRSGSEAQYLVEKHSLEVIPGALLLSRAPEPPKRNGWFLGVGDPIYNTADPRWQARAPGPFRGWFAMAGTDQLNRLVASGNEASNRAREAGRGVPPRCSKARMRSVAGLWSWPQMRLQ